MRTARISGAQYRDRSTFRSDLAARINTSAVERTALPHHRT
jgi:hypothetical protein